MRFLGLGLLVCGLLATTAAGQTITVATKSKTV